MHRYYVSQPYTRCFARRFAKAIFNRISSHSRAKGADEVDFSPPPPIRPPRPPSTPPEAAQRALYYKYCDKTAGPRTHERSEASAHGLSLYTKDFNVTIVCQQNTIYYPFLANAVCSSYGVDALFVIYTTYYLYVCAERQHVFRFCWDIVSKNKTKSAVEIFFWFFFIEYVLR